MIGKTEEGSGRTKENAQAENVGKARDVEEAQVRKQDEDAMALASSHSQEELEKMLGDETEAFGGMVEDDDNMADASSHSDESDDDI